MKSILLFTCLITLLASTGCIVGDGGRHRHARYERQDEAPRGPTVVVRPPEVILRPPAVIVR